MRHAVIVSRKAVLHVVPKMAMKELKLSMIEQFVLPIPEAFVTYTVPSAAKRLDVAPQRIYQLIEDNTLQGIRLLDEDGDVIKVVVTQQSVKAYLEYRANKAALKRPSFG